MECAKAKIRCEGGSLGRPAGAPRRKSAKTAARVESDSEEEGPARKKQKTARSTSGASEGGAMWALVDVLEGIQGELVRIRETLEEVREETHYSARMVATEIRKARKRAEVQEVEQGKEKSKEVEESPEPEKEKEKEKEAEEEQEKGKEGDEPMEIAE